MHLDLFAFIDEPELPYDEADVSTWFQPGRVVLVEDLVARGITVEQFFGFPFQLVLMHVRDADLRMFSVDMLRLFDDGVSSVEVGRGLSPPFCTDSARLGSVFALGHPVGRAGLQRSRPHGGAVAGRRPQQDARAGAHVAALGMGGALRHNRG